MGGNSQLKTNNMRNLIIPRKSWLNGKYMVNKQGQIFKTDGTELNYHFMPSGGYFVRLCGKGKMLTISRAKVVLMAFNLKGYKSSLIAIHKDGDILNNKPANLQWGTRYDQVMISMQKPHIKKRIYNMAKKYHGK